jgi:hypothetical protein
VLSLTVIRPGGVQRTVVSLGLRRPHWEWHPLARLIKAIDRHISRASTSGRYRPELNALGPGWNAGTHATGHRVLGRVGDLEILPEHVRDRPEEGVVLPFETNGCRRASAKTA